MQKLRLFTLRCWINGEGRGWRGQNKQGVGDFCYIKVGGEVEVGRSEKKNEKRKIHKRPHVY